MNRVEYNQFVRQIENQFHGKPRELEKVAKRYIGFSYGYLALIIIATVLILAALVTWVVTYPNVLALIIGIAVLVFLFSVIRGLRVKTLPPEGIAISPQDSPVLFELLDDLRSQVANAKFDQIIVNGDFNASACQIPRLGLLGWYRSYLVLGLPLMQVLSLEEFKSVLAHEFSHLSNKDGSSGNWIYRIRVAWEQIMASIHESGGTWVLAPFVRWFWPRLNAHAFVLSRQFEYRADAASIDYTGLKPMADSLQKVEFYGRFIEEKGWRPIFDTVNDNDSPPENPYHLLRTTLQETPTDSAEFEQWMNQAFMRPTDYSDTHPALKDRLLMADALPEAVSAAEKITIPEVDLENSSAIALFGAEKEQEFMQQLNRDWSTSIEPIWKFRHGFVKEIREELGKEDDVKDVEGAWKWASAMLELNGSKAALPWVEKTLAYDPNHVPARFTKACYLIEQNDASGVPILQQIAKEDPQYGFDALGMLKMHYSNCGDFKNYEAVDQQADQFEELVDKAQQERATITANDSFVDHNFTPPVFDKIKEELAEFSYIKSCYVACKTCTHFPKSPCYVFIIIPKATAYVNDNTPGQIAEAIVPHIDGYFMVFLQKQNRSVAKIITKMPSAIIYQK